ncbi:hypothetical protein TPA0908_08060 [Micromonospora sp. AKA38]|nr:hypothetical protein TPA0908_08060 [Micromonospora sp. AKA38]
MLGGVGPQLAERGAAARAALVEQHRAVAPGIEEPPRRRHQTTAGPTVQEHHGYAVRPADLLHVQDVAVTDRDPVGGVRLDGRVEGDSGHAR